MKTFIHLGANYPFGQPDIPSSAPSTGSNLLDAMSKAQESGELSKYIKEQIARTEKITEEDLRFRVR
jgi:hypothetical protein